MARSRNARRIAGASARRPLGAAYPTLCACILAVISALSAAIVAGPAARIFAVSGCGEYLSWPMRPLPHGATRCHEWQHTAMRQREVGAPEQARASGGGTRSGRTTDEARKLLADIVDVIRSAGVEAGAVRSFQAARAAAQTAADLIRSGDALTLIESLNALSRGDRPNDAVLARVFRQLFERLGATYVKLGQFIASSPTLFPEAYVREFQKCLDQTEVTPFSVIERTVERELGRPISAAFRSFNRTPLASASVAQVHAAVLPTGEEVVVKVQKPGVSKVLQADLGFLYISARVLEFLSPELSRSSLVDIVAEIRTSMLNELDFGMELQNLEVFRKFLVDNALTGTAAAPKPYPDFSATLVLTMERFRGVPLIDLDGIRAYSANPEATLIAALNVWALSVARCELFHADVHAGNLLVLEDGRIGFIDFGIVGRVPPKILRAVESLGTSLVREDALGIARALITMGATDAAVDESRLAADVKEILGRFKGLQPEVVVRGRVDGSVAAQVQLDEREVTELLLDVVRVSADNGLKLPREFALLLKQALYFDRYTKLLAPGLDALRDGRVSLGLSGDVYSARTSSPRSASTAVIDV